MFQLRKWEIFVSGFWKVCLRQAVWYIFLWLSFVPNNGNSATISSSTKGFELIWNSIVLAGAPAWARNQGKMQSWKPWRTLLKRPVRILSGTSFLQPPFYSFQHIADLRNQGRCETFTALTLPCQFQLIAKINYMSCQTKDGSSPSLSLDPSTARFWYPQIYLSRRCGSSDLSKMFCSHQYLFNR